MDIQKEHIEDYEENLSFQEDTEDELYEHYKFVADKGQSLLRIDKFLVDRITGASRNRIQMAADAGYVLVNNTPVKSNYKVKPLDVVTVVMDRPRRELEIIPEDIPLDIIYEDDDLMVINKPPGLVVHPGHGNYTGTLVNAIAWHLKDTDSYDARDPRLGLVHRIDKDTSGLLVIAKNPDAKTHLGLQFFNRTTKRRYWALVWGNVKEDEGRIEGNIGRHPREKMQMTVFAEEDMGKPAVTHYKVLERFGYVTLLECRLETGRTHQIRVHTKHIGHTIFNDERYGGNEILKGSRNSKYKQFIKNCFDICPRQTLHAKTLGFTHPKTGEELYFESQLPEDMSQLIEKWRSYNVYNYE
ncbi:23S rRNA pseudouridine1911/1915/1917 synthase [Dysgonomonadaceae bacterium PH5-43]|nr:23S rRNA pseudouridine1911/1915/1917 synthase [Dysgonomonadaceae bacterium PH5-43]